MTDIVTDTTTPQPDTTGSLGPELVERFLRHLDLDPRPEPTLDTLTSLYQRWCAVMPYDNGRIRQSLYAHPDQPATSATAADLLRENIAHGRSGQCTETADGLYCLLREIGYDAHLCLAHYGGATREKLEVNHISVLVRIDRTWVVTDTVLLSGLPIPLRPHQAQYPPLEYQVSQDALGAWAIRTVTPVGRAPVVCRLFYLTRDRSVCPQMFAAIQTEGFADFNANFYGRRLVDGELVTLSTSAADRSILTLHRTGLGGTVSVDCHTAQERAGAMVDGLGFSPEYVASLPPDTPPT